jgi:hypothetical protein
LVSDLQTNITLTGSKNLAAVIVEIKRGCDILGRITKLHFARNVKILPLQGEYYGW